MKVPRPWQAFWRRGRWLRLYAACLLCASLRASTGVTAEGVPVPLLDSFDDITPWQILASEDVTASLLYGHREAKHVLSPIPGIFNDPVQTVRAEVAVGF